MAGGAASPGADALAHKLDVKDGPFADWLDNELLRRARHICAETMGRFHTEEWAVSTNGQVRSGSRHEKDDTPASTTAATTSSAGPMSRRSPLCGRRPPLCSRA